MGKSTKAKATAKAPKPVKEPQQPQKLVEIRVGYWNKLRDLAQDLLVKNGIVAVQGASGKLKVYPFKSYPHSAVNNGRYVGFWDNCWSSLRPR